MTELELLKVIGSAQDVHILDADEVPVKKKPIPFSKPVIRAIAAVLAVVLAIGLFLQTPIGVAAAKAVKEQFFWFLDILFPPKDMVMYVEGEPETVHVEAQGREPETDSPGFSIYVDTNSYVMTEEDSAWFIRPLQASSELPPIEMEIREISDKAPMELAEETSSKIDETWNVSNIQTHWLENGSEMLAIDAMQGTSWDSVMEDHRFISNLQGGCYHVVIRYFMEAAEGAGVRLHNMLKTFTIVAPQDISGYSSESHAVVKAMEQEIAYAQEQDSWQNDSLDPETAAMERNARWLDIHQKLWDLLHRSVDRNSFQDLIANQLNWGAQKRIAVNLIDLNNRAAWEAESAKWVKERCFMLLRYLNASTSLAPRDPSLVLDPEPMVREIAAAYFSGDHETIQKYLSESYWGVVEIHSSGTEVIHAIKGLSSIPQDMAAYGRLNASVEFRETPDSDSFCYLSITLIWENGHWAIASYGLEQ